MASKAQMLMLAQARRRRAEAEEENKPLFDLNVPEELKADVPELSPEGYAKYMAGSPAGRLVKGVATPLEGLTQLAAHEIIDPITGVAGLGHPAGELIDEQVSGSKEYFDEAKKAQGQEGLDLLNLAGSMALPVAATKGIPAAQGLFGRMGQGAVVGGSTAVTMPLDEYSQGDKAKQAGIGSTLGGGIPLLTAGAGKLGGYVDDLTRPWPMRNALEKTTRKVSDYAGNIVDDIKSSGKELFGGEKVGKGIYKDVSQYIDDIMEDSNIPRQKVIDALLKSESKVKGNTPTSAQALTDDIMANPKSGRYGSPLIRLESDLERSRAGDILKSKSDKAIHAREQPLIDQKNTIMDDFSPIPEKDLPMMLRQQADDPILNIPSAKAPYTKAPSVESVQAGGLKTKELSALEEAMLIRSQNAKAGYGAVAKDVPNKDVIIDEILKRPASIKAIKKAQEGIQNKYGKDAWPDNVENLNIQQLGRIKKELADTINDKTTGLKGTEKDEFTSLVKDFNGLIRDKSKGYASAEDQFIKDSVPINRIKLADAILNKMRTATGGEGRGQMLRSMQDEAKLIKQGTGFRADSIDDVFDPQMAKHTRNVAKEMERDAKAKMIAGESTPVLSGLKSEVEPLFPRILNTKAAVSNWALQKIGKDATPQYERALAEIMKNPKNLAEVIKMQQTKGMTEGVLLNKINNMITSSVGASTGKAIGE